MFDLDNKYPIIFFPIRIESRYAITRGPTGITNKRVLRLRFFPDVITINNFDHRFTKKEAEDARHYWKTQDKSARDSVWTNLANKYGLPRAAYIVKAIVDKGPINSSVKTDDKLEIREEETYFSPSCKLLPSRFAVYAKFKNPKLNRLGPVGLQKLPFNKEPFGKEIPESLPLDPKEFEESLPLLPQDPHKPLSTSESPNWVIDFDEAVKKGMGIEIDLDEEQYKSGFEYIIVFGVREGVPPEKIKQSIEDLFTAHRYSKGMSFIKQGTPTNLVVGKSKDKRAFFSSHSFTQSDINTYRALEFASLEKERPGLITTHAPDGRIFERALGLQDVASGLENANNDDHMTAICMFSALWPSIVEDPINKFVAEKIQSDHLGPVNFLLRKDLFVNYVSAQGFIPPIRLGKTPYGILPVTILSEFTESFSMNGVRDFFTRLKTKWNNLVDQVPTVMNSADGTLQTETLLNILSMEPISHTYSVRGFRSLDYITDFVSEILNNKNISNDDLKIKNKLLLGILLKQTFPVIPKTALDMFSGLCPGSDTAEIKFPMVNMPDDSDILVPNYIKDMLDDIKGPDRHFLKSTEAQKEIQGIGPSNTDPLLLKLLRYSASKIGEKDQVEIDKFAESLEVLRDKSPERLKALMLQTLDLVSYRLDAWISSFANLRLDRLRKNKRVGLHAGAFGWIENLIPKEFENEVRSINPVREGGYIHAPSYTHAATAAVLRNGYLTHSNESDKKDLLKINLNSSRTKNALEIINGIGNTPLSELLGYRLERRLHDAELDYLIDEFRKHFPLNKHDIKEIQVTAQEGQEIIEPRNLTDGLAVFKNWKRLTGGVPSSDDNTIISLMENDEIAWKQFYSEIKKYGSVNLSMVNIINHLKTQLNYLLDQMDGVSDLCLAEAVYQAVGGNYLRSGAVLDGMSGDGQIPTPEISLIPRSGTTQVQKVGLAVEVETMGALNLQDINDNIPWTSPRKLAEPNFSKLINTFIGGISFWLDVRDLSDNVISTEELGLSELGIEAIDLLYLENSEIEARINYYGKIKGITNFKIRYGQIDSSAEQLEKRSYRDLQFLMKSMRGLMAQGQPLKYSDFIYVGQSVPKEKIIGSIKEMFKRYYDIIHMVHQTIQELNLAKDDNTEENVEKKRLALIKAGFFLKEYAVPLDSKGNIIESVEVLNNMIKHAIDQLKSRFSQGEDQIAKLSSWRSALKDKGEEAFLKSIVNEFTGEPEDAAKYIQTIDILVGRIKTILGTDSFLILLPINIQKEVSDKLKSSFQINKDLLKWIGKASYVRPRLKFLDEIISYNQILELTNFSFYCDETKFMNGASGLLGSQFLEKIAESLGIDHVNKNYEELRLLIEKFAESLGIDHVNKNDNELWLLILEKINKEQLNPVSLILAMSTKTAVQEKTFVPTNLVGVVVDEWTDKFVAKEQDTCIAFHYDGPNTEAPQSLLLAVAPNDDYKWNEDSILKVLLETLELLKLRAVDYSSLKELRNFLPTLLFNSHGEDVHINLYQKGVTE